MVGLFRCSWHLPDAQCLLPSVYCEGQLLQQTASFYAKVRAGRGASGLLVSIHVAMSDSMFSPSCCPIARYDMRF